MLFKPCIYKWESLRSGDAFFSHGCDPVGGIIRFGEKPSIKSLTDRTLPNHAGFVYAIRGRWFAAEVGPQGIAFNSLDKYRGKRNQIVAVVRWHGFDDQGTLDRWERDIAAWVDRKQGSGYDLWGAVRASDLARTLFPWLKNKKGEEFCSEDVYTWLRTYGMVFPLTWEKYPPNPLQLWQWMKDRACCTNILDFKEYK